MPTSLVYAVPYLALFAIALGMRGRRSLVVLSVTLGLPIGWLTLEGFRSITQSSGGAGLGAVIASGVIFIAAAGFVSGVAVRGIMLWVPRLRHSALLVIVGLLALPSVLGAKLWWSEQSRRVPDEACLTAKHHVRIADLDLWLPSAPLFTAQPGEKERYAFSLHQHMRSFCRISLDADKPIKLVNLSVSPKELTFNGHPQRDKFCATGKQGWVKQLCNTNGLTAYPGHLFPENIAIYSPSEYDHRSMLASDRGTYARFMEEREAGLKSGQPVQQLETDELTRFANGYWIARDDAWKNDGGEPFTLHCYDTPPAGMLYCVTTYRLREGPQVTYAFRAYQNQLASTARMIDANFHVLLKSLART